jgi:hypothetical protein
MRILKSISKIGRRKLSTAAAPPKTQELKGSAKGTPHHQPNNFANE